MLVRVFITWLGVTAYPIAVRLARTLRGAGVCTELLVDALPLKKALRLAHRLNAEYAVIIGDREIAAGCFAVKRLADAMQSGMNEAKLLETLKQPRPDKV